jgi:hypothetical protein
MASQCVNSRDLGAVLVAARGLTEEVGWSLVGVPSSAGMAFMNQIKVYGRG